MLAAVVTARRYRAGRFEVIFAETEEAKSCKARPNQHAQHKGFDHY